jgi:hypothetical protein
VLNVLRRLAEYDPVPEVKKGAQEAVRKFEQKLIYFDIVELYEP